MNSTGLVLSLLLVSTVPPAAPPKRSTVVGSKETVARFYGQMPTGVTVSQGGRVFLCFPRWGDRVKFTVGELHDRRTTPYPPGINNDADPRHGANGLVSVQSVVADAANRLWMLDTGSVKFGRTYYGGPKLVAVDLRTDRVVKTILFPRAVALPTSYLNDVRFDLRRGTGGMAFITDSSNTGPNAIIVVDLGTGKSWRRLNDAPSVRAEPGFVPVVQGQRMMQRKPGRRPAPLTTGVDGIAISADGKRLFYCPLAGRHLYSVSADTLAYPRFTDAQVAAAVRDLGDKGFASDGLVSDAAGNLYLTDYEHAAIREGKPGGPYRIVVQDPAIVWPDTLSIAITDHLYFTDNQLPLMPTYHNGQDLRKPPYYLSRTRVSAGPVLLR